MLIHGIFEICLNQRRVILCRAFLQELLDFLITQCSLPKCDLVDGSLEMIARCIKDSISAHAKGKVGPAKVVPIVTAGCYPLAISIENEFTIIANRSDVMPLPRGMRVSPIQAAGR